MPEGLPTLPCVIEGSAPQCASVFLAAQCLCAQLGVPVCKEPRLLHHRLSDTRRQPRSPLDLTQPVAIPLTSLRILKFERSSDIGSE